MRKIAAVVTRDGLGHVGTEDRQFGLDMLDRFLHAIKSQTVKPHAICFYTDGVNVVCKGSPVFLSLKLQDLGFHKEDSLKTVWQTFTRNSPGNRHVLVHAEKTIWQMIEELKKEGLYLAERRED